MAFKVVHYQNEAVESEAMAKIARASLIFLRHTSQLAAQIIDYLEARNPPVTIVVKDTPDRGFNGWAPGDATMAGGSGKVMWCSARPKAAGEPSAELALMHELGHEYQLHTDRGEVLATFNSNGSVRDGISPNRYYGNFEDTVVLAIERPVAHDINAFLKDTMGVKEGHLLYEPIRKAYVKLNVFGVIKGSAPYVKQDAKPSPIEKSPRAWTNR